VTNHGHAGAHTVDVLGRVDELAGTGGTSDAGRGDGNRSISEIQAETGGSGGKPVEHAQSTARVPRERSRSPITNGPTGFVRGHMVRSASREESEHGPYRKSRARPSIRRQEGSLWPDGSLRLNGLAGPREWSAEPL